MLCVCGGGCYLRCSTWNALFQRGEGSQRGRWSFIAPWYPTHWFFKGLPSLTISNAAPRHFDLLLTQGPASVALFQYLTSIPLVDSPICCLDLSKTCCLVTCISRTLWLTSEHLSEIHLIEGFQIQWCIFYFPWPPISAFLLVSEAPEMSRSDLQLPSSTTTETSDGLFPHKITFSETTSSPYSPWPLSSSWLH